MAAGDLDLFGGDINRFGVGKNAMSALLAAKGCVLFVDGNNTLGTPDGSFSNPFLDPQDAVDKFVADGITDPDPRVIVFLSNGLNGGGYPAGGTTLTLPDRGSFAMFTIGGPVLIGSLSPFVARNVERAVDSAGTAPAGTIPITLIVGDAPAGIGITGDVILRDNVTAAQVQNFSLRGCSIIGQVDATNQTNRLTAAWLIDSIFNGAVNAPSMEIADARQSLFNSDLTVEKYGRMHACRVTGNVTVTAAPTTTGAGWHDSNIGGNFSGPALSFLLDDVSLQHFINAGGTTSGGAAPRVIGTDVSYSAARGLVSGGEMTRPGALTVDVAAGEGYVYNGGALHRVVWAAQSEVLPASSTSTVYVDEAGDVKSTTVALTRTNLDEWVILGTAVTDGSTIVVLSEHRVPATQRNALIHQRADEVDGPIAVTGGIVTENGGTPLHLDITAATFWITDDRKTTSALVDAALVTVYRDGGGGFTWGSAAGVDNAQYDDGTGTLAAIPAGEYAAHAVYIAPNVDGGAGSSDVVVQYAQTTYATEEEAVGGPLPLPPDVLRRHSLRLAITVVQQGTASIVSIVDERPFPQQLGPSVNGAAIHGNLLGLGADDHTQYQLRSEQSAANGYPSLDGSATVPPAELPAATLTAQGAVELATQAEVDAGVDAVRAVTPATLAGTQPLVDGDTRQFFFRVQNPSTTRGLHRVLNIGANGSSTFSFAVPAEAATITGIDLIGISTAGAAGAGKDVDISSEYGAVGEQFNNHAETDTTSTYTYPADGVIFSFDMTGVFTSLAANDFAALEVDHNAIGGAVDYLGVLLTYTV